MKNFLVSTGRERGFEPGLSGVPAECSIISAIETFSLIIVPIRIYPSRTIRSYHKIHCMRFANILRLQKQKEKRERKRTACLSTETRNTPQYEVHTYYSIALFTDRSKAKRPSSSTEAPNTSYILMSHQSIFTTHTYEGALANPPPPPSLLLAVLIDRTE